MDRTELAHELVGISKNMAEINTVRTASEMSQARRTVAARMVLLAKRLVGFDMSKEFEATVKTTGELAKQFKDAHADLIREINDAEKALKEKRDILAAYYKDWATNSGYKPLRAALLQQAQQCMAIGDTLDNLAEDLEVARRESAQESYKEKYNVLVSTLNEAELKKFSRILNSFFNKQVTEVKTGLKDLDGELKEWHESAQAIAEERGIKLPKASERTASVIEDVAEAIRTAIPRLVETVRNFFSDLLARVLRNGDTLNDMDRELGTMVAKARSVL